MDVKSTDQCSAEFSPLMEAVDAGDVKRVQELLRKGADPNYVTSACHESALTVAAKNGNEELFFLLVQYGAKLDNPFRDYELTTAPEGAAFVLPCGELLDWALCGMSERIVRHLVDPMEDMAQWKPSFFPSAIQDTERRVKVYSWGIKQLTDRLLKLYGDDELAASRKHLAELESEGLA